MTKPTLLLSLDVESYGILGNAFSYGIVLWNIQHQEALDEVYEFSETSLDEVRERGIDQWVEDNVVSVAGKSTTHLEIEESFIHVWSYIQDTYNSKYQIIWCADSPHPVESLFISNVIRRRLNYRVFEDKSDLELSPYPLLDIASMRWSLGLPTTFDRLPNELPAHNPHMDARQSLRGLLEAIDKANSLGIQLQF
jgi:hypothetical protein